MFVNKRCLRIAYIGNLNISKSCKYTSHIQHTFFKRYVSLTKLSMSRYCPLTLIGCLLFSFEMRHTTAWLCAGRLGGVEGHPWKWMIILIWTSVNGASTACKMVNILHSSILYILLIAEIYRYLIPVLRKTVEVSNTTSLFCHTVNSSSSNDFGVMRSSDPVKSPILVNFLRSSSKLMRIILLTKPRANCD